MAEKAIIGVDIGGTRIRAAHCDSHLNIIKREETLTLDEEGLDATLNRIKDLIRKVAPDGIPLEGIGISAPGPLNPETGVIVAPPNLAGWHNVPLGDIVSAEFGVPVYVGNDANVAALAETLRGAAVGYKDVIYITVSTGIGSGMIIDGRMLLGSTGLAAEAGHVIILTGGKVSSLELEAAGPALVRKAVARISAGEPSKISDLVNGDLSRIDGKIIGIAAHASDAMTLEIVRSSAHLLGLGMVSLLHLFNPEIVVFGGGVISGLGDIYLDPLKQAIREHALDQAYWQELRIETAVLGEDVSIIGSAALVPTKGGVTKISELKAFFGAQN